MNRFNPNPTPGASALKLYLLCLVFSLSVFVQAGDESLSLLDGKRRERGTHLSMPAEAEAGVEKALAYFAAHQVESGPLRGSLRGYNGTDTGVVASVLLAYMAAGNVPGRGRYGKQAARCVEYLLNTAQPWTPDSEGRTQLFLYRQKGADGGPMYHHALATLALAEVWGESRDERVGETLKPAVRLILSAQSVGKDKRGRLRYGANDGGWRYMPRPSSADLSVTAMNVIALRAAEGAGLYVPVDRMRRAMAFVLRCYEKTSGGFTYLPKSGKANLALTGGGSLALQLGGHFATEEVTTAVRFLQKADIGKVDEYRYYAYHYAAQSMYQYGKGWEVFYQSVLKQILADQSGQNLENAMRGSIFNGRAGRAHYTTAAGVQVMCIPRRCLPIYQR